jgi:hypothetical protein
VDVRDSWEVLRQGGEFVVVRREQRFSFYFIVQKGRQYVSTLLLNLALQHLSDTQSQSVIALDSSAEHAVLLRHSIHSS